MIPNENARNDDNDNDEAKENIILDSTISSVSNLANHQKGDSSPKN